MAKIDRKSFLYYVFSCIEIFLLLFIFIVEPQLLKLKFQEVKIIYNIFIFSAAAIEIIYFIRVKRKKAGYIGLPITLLLVFRYNILEKLSMRHIPISAGAVVFFGMIILIRLYEIVFILKNKSVSKDFFSYKGILSSLMVDLLSLLRFSNFL